jgi:uncharacterized membrane protein YhaH (DUF805 family)
MQQSCWAADAPQCRLTKTRGERRAAMNWYLEVLKKYAVFSGRARRKEYWMFALFNFIIFLVLEIVLGMAGAIIGSDLNIIGLLYTLAVILPSLSVGVRRLHDIGRSGWWLLIAFVPLIGAIVLLLFHVKDSTPGENEYGENPKETAA